jgi:hypothetical protein
MPFDASADAARRKYKHGAWARKTGKLSWRLSDYLKIFQIMHLLRHRTALLNAIEPCITSACSANSLLCSVSLNISVIATPVAIIA